MTAPTDALALAAELRRIANTPGYGVGASFLEREEAEAELQRLIETLPPHLNIVSDLTLRGWIEAMESGDGNDEAMEEMQDILDGHEDKRARMKP